jgi:hypothetical protein
MILPLTYEARDRTKTDRGTITLKLTRNAKRFEGRIALYSDEKDSIASTDIIWFRSRKLLDEYIEELDQQRTALEEYRKRTKEAEEARQKLKKETTLKHQRERFKDKEEADGEVQPPDTSKRTDAQPQHHSASGPTTRSVGVEDQARPNAETKQGVSHQNSG